MCVYVCVCASASFMFLSVGNLSCKCLEQFLYSLTGSCLYRNQRCPLHKELVYSIFVFSRSVDGGKIWSVVLMRVGIDPGSFFL